eukprot:8659327-Lingulodinium_polyedra.AAC.1
MALLMQTRPIRKRRAQIANVGTADGGKRMTGFETLAPAFHAFKRPVVGRGRPTGSTGPFRRP